MISKTLDRLSSLTVRYPALTVGLGVGTPLAAGTLWTAGSWMTAIPFTIPAITVWAALIWGSTLSPDAKALNRRVKIAKLERKLEEANLR